MANSLNPYLIFNGKAEEAIALYQRALGAELAGPIMRFGDVEGAAADPKNKNRVMHAALRVDGGMIMISDSMPDQPVVEGANVQVVLNFDDKAEEIRRFEALAQGGKVTMPLQDTFWGAHYGQLVDAFGVSWMFNCDLKKS